MTKICRYIDDQPSIFFWDLDQIIIFSAFFGMGIIIGKLLVCGIIGILVTYILTKHRKEKSDGYLFHILYWWGLITFKKSPPGYIRTFVE